jgi:hypothetical protein
MKNIYRRTGSSLIGKLSEGAAVVSNYVLPIIDGIQMSLWGISWFDMSLCELGGCFETEL